MKNNDDVFLKQMKGVSPIKRNHRVKKEELKTKHTVLKKNKTKLTSAIPPIADKVIKNSKFKLEKVSLKKGIKKRSFSKQRKRRGDPVSSRFFC